MPYKRRRPPPRKHKRTGWEKQRFKNMMAKKYKAPLPLGGFLKSKMVRLRYVQEFTLDPAVNTPLAKVFRANDMYNCDAAMTNQPANFDTWMSLYDHFTVLGSKCTAIYTPTEAANITPAFLGIWLTDNGVRVAGVAGTPNLIEQKNVRWSKRILGPNAGAFQGPGAIQVTKKFSAAKFFGKKKAVILGDDQYRGDVATSPTDKAYFEVFMAPVGGGNPTLANLMVVIDFIAVLSERKPDDNS